MLVLKVEGEEFALDYLGDWNSVSLKRGMVLDVLLASGDPSYPPDLWAGFLVMEVFVNMASDGNSGSKGKESWVCRRRGDKAFCRPSSTARQGFCTCAGLVHAQERSRTACMSHVSRDSLSRASSGITSQVTWVGR